MSDADEKETFYIPFECPLACLCTKKGNNCLPVSMLGSEVNVVGSHIRVDPMWLRNYAQDQTLVYTGESPTGALPHQMYQLLTPFTSTDRMCAKPVGK
jgi:hypothetical protein